GRRLRTLAEEELLHLAFEELASLRLHRREPVFVDQHRLVREPTPPRELRHALVDALAELAGIRRPVEAFSLRAEHYTLHHPGHAESPSVASLSFPRNDRRCSPRLSSVVSNASIGAGSPMSALAEPERSQICPSPSATPAAAAPSGSSS